MAASIDRLKAIAELVDSLRLSYPDAKKFNVNVQFEWQTPVDADLDSELCPVVKIDIERG
jgi:hypothetical protein